MKSFEVRPGLAAVGLIAMLVACGSDPAESGPTCDEACDAYEACSAESRDVCLEYCESDWEAPEATGCRPEQETLLQCHIDNSCNEESGSFACETERLARNQCVCAVDPDFWACDSAR